MSKSDTDDPFGFSLIDEALTKCVERRVIFSGDFGDEKEDGSDMGTPTSGLSDAFSFTADIGERCYTSEL